MMKKLLTLTLVMILASCSSNIVKPETVSATDGQATVTLIKPHNFTDIDTGNFGVQSNFEQRVAKDLAEALADHFKETDLTIDIIFSDIDLAGETRYNMREIRILKDLYIPRMSFEYEIKDTSGVVKLADTVDIKDMNYLGKRLFGIKSNDLLGYDKRMLIEYFKKLL
jgi:phenylpyruvate tautomerase PptA (4-oxalocrotonate tautomerase family)